MSEDNSTKLDKPRAMQLGITLGFLSIIGSMAGVVCVYVLDAPDREYAIVGFTISYFAMLLLAGAARGSRGARLGYIIYQLLLDCALFYQQFHAKPGTNSTFDDIFTYGLILCDLISFVCLLLPSAGLWYADFREQWRSTDADWRSAYYRKRMFIFMGQAMLIPALIGAGRAIHMDRVFLLFSILPLGIVFFCIIASSWWQSHRQKPAEVSWMPVKPPAKPAPAPRP